MFLSKALPVFARQTTAKVGFAQQAANQIVRNFCAVPAAEETKVPDYYTGLKINSHTGRYAGQMFEVALEHDMDHDDILQSLITISDAISDDSDLKMYLEDNSVKEAEKAETLEDVYLELEANDPECFVDEMAEDMVALLIENKELHLLPEVVADFSRMVLDYNDEVEATVVTAEKMTEDQEQRVYDKLSELAGEDMTVLMECEVDPELLGGMTITLGEQYQDLSVRSALNVAEAALRAQ